MENFYELLGIKTNANDLEIKKAYLHLVTKYHPDIYMGDKKWAEDYTARITEAYSILKDKDKRLDYDIKNNINRNPSKWDLKREERALKKQQNKNNSQQNSMKYFKNSKQSPAKKRKHILSKIFKSKLFYLLLVLFGVEVAIIFVVSLNTQFF